MSEFKTPGTPDWQNGENSGPLWDGQSNFFQDSHDDPHSAFYEDPNSIFGDLSRKKKKKSKPAQPEETPKQKSASDDTTAKDPAQEIFGVSGPDLQKHVGSAASWAESDADRTAEKAKNPNAATPTPQQPPASSSTSETGAALPGLPKTGGQELSQTLKDQFSPIVGNLDHIRVHDTPHSHAANAHIGAEGFIDGPNIHLSKNADKNKVIPHELGHVPQKSKKIRRKASSDGWAEKQAEIARQDRIIAQKAAEAKRIAAEKAAAKRRAEARAQKLAVVRKLKHDSQLAVNQQSRDRKLAQVGALKDKALREQDAHHQRQALQATLKHYPGLKTFGNGALSLGKDLLNPAFSKGLMVGPANYAAWMSKPTEKGGWWDNAQKQGQHLFQQATQFNAKPQQLPKMDDSGSASFMKQTTPTPSTPAPSKSKSATALQTQPPGWWERGKAIAKQQLQDDLYGTNVVPQPQQTGLKTGLEWAQHQYQGAQQQGKAWETQLRQSSVGKVVAPAWDAYQTFDQQKTDAVRGFAKGIDPTIRSWTDTAYDFLDKPLKLAEDQTKNIPIVGGLTQAANTLTRAQMQVGTGAVKFAGGFVGGLASLATDPGAAAKGLLTIAEHAPPATLIPSFMGGPLAGKVLNKLGVPMVNPLKALHGAYDVVVNGEDYNSRMRDRVFNPKASMAEDIKVGKALGSGLIEPMKKSWEQGKPVEAITQGVLEVASLFVGLGEAKAGSKLGEAGKLASEAEKAGSIADKASDASKVAKGADAATANQKIGGASKIVRDEAALKLTPERLQMRKNGEALQKSLPKRQQVPIEVDPALHGNTVQVHYSMNKGQITDVHIKAGPEATVKDIQLHGTTVKRMQQYSGLSHHAQLLKDRWTGWRNQHGVPPVGTKGWEAQLELQKLPKIIEDRANRLAKGGLDEKSQLRLEAELSDLKHQMATHEKTFKTMDKNPGKGFVAVESAPQTDVGLSNRGYSPQPGKRSMTKEQWKAQSSEQRAANRTSKADQPLENPHPNASTQGHGHGDHGYQTTDIQQGDRIRTQMTPSGRMGAPINNPSKFRSPQAEAEALGRGARQRDADIAGGLVPPNKRFPDPITGNPTYVDPVTGEPTRYTTFVTTDSPKGFGYKVTKQRDPVTNQILRDANGQPLTVADSTPIKRAIIVWEYSPSKGTWNPLTYYPKN
jgi:Domain of unknown function (DUF4157)